MKRSNTKLGNTTVKSTDVDDFLSNIISMSVSKFLKDCDDKKKALNQEEINQDALTRMDAANGEDFDVVDNLDDFVEKGDCFDAFEADENNNYWKENEDLDLIEKIEDNNDANLTSSSSSSSSTFELTSISIEIDLKHKE